MSEVKVGYFAKVSGIFFKHWRYTLLLWVFILGFGLTAYTNLIKREGFPPIKFPITVISGTYLVNDKDVVDKSITQPISGVVSKMDYVKNIDTTAGDNYFSAVVEFKQDIPPAVGTSRLKQAIEQEIILPEHAVIRYRTIKPASFQNKYDLMLAVYSTQEVPVKKLDEVAKFVALGINKNPDISKAERQSLLNTAINPTTLKSETRQTNFNQIGINQDSKLAFYPAVTVGINRVEDKIDAIELSSIVREYVDSLDLSQFGDNFKVAVSADQAKVINTQINSLQSNLLTGLISVALVSFLLITWRASIITGLFMITVVAVTVAILYVVGYTLNTITLFALVLSLGLFVDDATIVIESIDASNKKKRKPHKIVAEAVNKIGAASFAGTMTTVLVFLPLAFVTGILGEFIRLMPITVVIALITSLVLSITLIPFLSRFILLHNKQDSWITRNNPISKLEKSVGSFVGSLPLLLKDKRPKGRLIAFTMVGLSLVFIGVGLMFASKLSFNIFPASKDSNQLGLAISYPPNYSLTEAEDVATSINSILVQHADVITGVTYGRNSSPNERGADMLLELTPFNTRDIKSPKLISNLQEEIKSVIPTNVTAKLSQFDAGPPAEEFPLHIQVFYEDLKNANKLSQEIEKAITGAKITRTNGTVAHITKVKMPSSTTVLRSNGKKTLDVKASFDAEDTSALLSAAQNLVEEKFTPEYLTQNGYAVDSIGFDFGQETRNAESFSSLSYIFPIALAMMFVLLALQFKSFLQPLLIFVAIPFTFFGVFLGLYVSNNALSFFVQVGLIGLIGIAVNNTILLTEYANQERNNGFSPTDAISRAVTKRFRPLIATTTTTIVALWPLARSDPFWEPMAYTIIFGLASSTFLVILAFPYYYLVAEKLRHLRKK